MTRKCLTPAVVPLFVQVVAHVFCDRSKCIVFRGSVSSFLSPMLTEMTTVLCECTINNASQVDYST